MHIGDLYHIDSHSFNYVSIPIVSGENVEKYNKILDVSKDPEETLEKLEDELDFISIFYSEENDYINVGIIEKYDSIFSNLYYEDLIELGQRCRA